MALYRLLLFSLFAWAFANVEKTIFLGPPEISRPLAYPSLDGLSLISLSPTFHSIRTHLNASFQSDGEPDGVQSWLLLDQLRPHSRYEVRICWLATQPTIFKLKVFDLDEVFGDSELLGSLSTFAYDRLAALDDLTRQDLIAQNAQNLHSLQDSLPGSVVTPSSLLLLRISAAAEYYTLDQSLMENVPPVLVDIILDPYLLNVLPNSLFPTAGYIFLVAVVSWFFSGYFWQFFLYVVNLPDLAEPRTTEAQGKKDT